MFVSHFKQEYVSRSISLPFLVSVARTFGEHVAYQQNRAVSFSRLMGSDQMSWSTVDTTGGGAARTFAAKSIAILIQNKSIIGTLEAMATNIYCQALIPWSDLDLDADTPIETGHAGARSRWSTDNSRLLINSSPISHPPPFRSNRSSIPNLGRFARIQRSNHLFHHKIYGNDEAKSPRNL